MFKGRTKQQLHPHLHIALFKYSIKFKTIQTTDGWNLAVVAVVSSSFDYTPLIKLEIQGQGKERNVGSMTPRVVVTEGPSSSITSSFCVGGETLPWRSWGTLLFQWLFSFGFLFFFFVVVAGYTDRAVALQTWRNLYSSPRINRRCVS